MRLSSKDLQDHYGVDARTVTNWINETPGCPHRMESRRRWFDSVEVAAWYADRAVRKAPPPKPLDLADAQKRRAAAEAEMAEMERDQMRGELVSADIAREEMGHIATTLRAQLMAIPGRYAARTVGLGTLPESQRAWDTAIRDVLAELKDGA
jgi:phage terminase Nu1 subunit (DNA packaging protein)